MRSFRELKRRKVLHTLSLYVVGCWVALQVVEVLSEAGLPPTTMRHLLVAMSFGFPFVLVVAWFFDVSADGVTRTPPAAPDEALPELKLGDHALMAGLIAVIALNFYVLSSPPPAGNSQPAAPEQRTLVVMAFEDTDPQGGDESIGAVLASELRKEFTRVPGLRVLGPETSKVIELAGDARDKVAGELGVTAILSGSARLGEGRIQLDTRLASIPGGRVIWQAVNESNARDGIKLQKGVISAVLDAIIPAASASTTHEARVEAGECRDVYELYLRGKKANDRQRAIEILREAVRIDERCAIAWEALAVLSVDWTFEGFAKAAAAARRALELNDALPEAWTVLGEIAEEEGRWNESEEYFLRALYIDPANIRANLMYGEALMARGRVSEALQYSLEAYRYEPASSKTNWRVALTAIYANEGDVAVKHALNYKDVHINSWYDGWGEMAEGYLAAGQIEKATAVFADHADEIPEWYPRCIRARSDPGQAAGLLESMQGMLGQVANGEVAADGPGIWEVIRCAMMLGANDIVFDLLQIGGLPTEKTWFLFFHPDAGALRQDPRFRRRVVDSGLLDYWREWGWSDYCRPDGESFVCD